MAHLFYYGQNQSYVLKSNMDFSQKAQSVADKMNNLTSKLDLSEELLVQSDDIVDYVEGTTKDITLSSDTNYADIMNLEIMTDDFKFVRESLKEITKNARKVQNLITLDLLSDESDKNENRPSLIMSFSELSKAITDAQKLYVQSYKEMSTTLLNLDKIKKNKQDEGPTTVNNTLNINSHESLNTADFIKQLKECR